MADVNEPDRGAEIPDSYTPPGIKPTCTPEELAKGYTSIPIPTLAGYSGKARTMEEANRVFTTGKGREANIDRVYSDKGGRK